MSAYSERSGALYREIWLISDHLGTPRMIAERTGKLEGITRSDYLPFGESANQLGGRAATQGYVNESVRQGFTGYEEDGETGLDYAQARYYANGQGRFTAADPLMASANPLNPQTFNRYSYALNNPTRFTDPTGLITESQYDGTEEKLIPLQKMEVKTKQQVAAEERRQAEMEAASQQFWEEAGFEWFVGGANAEESSESETEAEGAYEGSATVYYWPPDDKNYGHMSVRFSDGTYISFWPFRSPGKLNSIIGEGSEEGLLQPTLAQDISSEGNRKPEEFTVWRLNVGAARDFFKQLEKNPGRWTIFRNCADIVAQALEVAGLPIANTQKGSSTPREVLDIIKRAEPSLLRRCVASPSWVGNRTCKRFPKDGPSSSCTN